MTVETYIESTVTIRIRLRDATDAEEIASRCHDLRELLAFDTLHQPDRTDVEVERTKPRIVRKRASPPVVRSDDEVARGASPVETESSAAAIGSIGGKARAEALSPERRSEIARAGANARWGNNSSEARAGTEGASPLDQQQHKAGERYEDGYPVRPKILDRA